MRKYVIAAVALVLASCGSEKSGSFKTDDGEGSYSIDEDSGNVAANITTEDGTFTMRSGDNVAVDLPKGYTIYPGATVVSNTVVSQKGGKGALIVMESKASPQEMSDFYKQQAEANGLEIKIQMKTDAGHMIAGEAENGKALTFNANSEDGKTYSQLMVQNGLGK